MKLEKFIIALSCTALLPLTGIGSPTKFNRYISHAQELFRMERYQEAYDEFTQAARHRYSNDAVTDELLTRMTALSATLAGRNDAEELLLAYLDEYPAAPGSPEVCFALGNLYLDHGQFAEAVNYYSQIYVKDLPAEYENEYNFKTGYANFKCGNYDTAIAYMSRIGFDNEYYPHAQYVLGYSEYRNNNYLAAKRYFTSIAGDRTYSNIIPFYMLQIEFNEGNYRYVRENGESVLHMVTGSRVTELNRIIGESWFHTGGWREASRYLHEYENLGGTMNREEYYMIGFAAYMTGNYDEAERYLSRVAGPDDSLSQNASYHLADCYIRMGRKQQAMQSFAIASTGGYDNTVSEDALFNYGKLQYELGGGYFNEAINVLNRYIQFYPDSPRASQAKEYLAAAYYNSKNYAAAYEAISQVPNPDNDMRAALQRISYFRALEFYNEGDYESASRLLEQSLQNRFNAKYTALAGYWQGELAYRKGDMKTAADRFTTYVRLSPRTESENIMARYGTGYAYFNQQKWDDAARWFDDFISNYPYNDSYKADAYNRRGDIAYAGRSFWRAIEYYDNAAKIGTPERYYSALQRAKMLGMVQRPERKIESLNDIIRKNEGPYVAEAMYELGKTYMERQQYKEAVSILERFAAAYPESPRYAAAMNELGLAYQNTNNNDKALACYKKVLEREKNSELARSAMNGVRTIYVERNDVDSYFAYAEKSGIQTDLGSVQRDSLAYAAAQKVYLSGDSSRAASALDNYIVNYPKGYYLADALYFAGENAVAAGNADRAAAYYRRLVAIPGSDFMDRGLERLGNVDMQLGNYSEAADSYLKLSRLPLANDKANNALSGYLKAVTATGNNTNIITAADHVLAHSTSEQVVRNANYAKASALTRLNRTSEALPLYEKLSKDVSTAEGAESAYRVIEAARKRRDSKAVENLVYEFADRNTPHSYWLAKAFILLGDTYAESGDKFQARATYQSVVDGYSNTKDGIIAEAKSRIAAL